MQVIFLYIQVIFIKIKSIFIENELKKILFQRQFRYKTVQGVRKRTPYFFAFH